MRCGNAQGQNELSLGYDRGQLEENAFTKNTRDYGIPAPLSLKEKKKKIQNAVQLYSLKFLVVFTIVYRDQIILSV